MTRTAAHRFRTALADPRAATIIIAAGVVLRLVALAAVAASPLRNDQRNYHDVAVLLLRGSWFSPNWPPGLPLWLALWYGVFGAHEIVARAAMLALFPPFAVFLRRAVLRAATPALATLALLFFAVSPTFIFHSIEPLTQLPAAVVLLGILLLLDRAGSLRWPGFAALGAALAALVLLRPSGALAAGGALLLLFARTRRIGSTLATAALAAVIAGAWITKASLMDGHIVPVNYNNSRNLFYGNNPYTPLYRTWWFGSHTAGDDVPAGYTRLIERIDSLPVHARDAVFRDAALAHIIGRPDLFAVRTLARFRCFLAYDTFTGSFLYKWYTFPRIAGLAAIGIDALLYFALIAAALLRAFLPSNGAPGGRTIRLAVWLAGLYAAPYWVSFAHPAYHFPILPLLAIPAASALAACGASRGGLRACLRELSPRRRTALLIAAAAFAAIQIEWTIAMIGRV